jgi:DNA repair protein RadC
MGAGHRQRLIKKFLDSGIKAFLDYEIVELLLVLGTPMKDCRQQAKDAIKRFGSFKGVLEASPEELQEIDGIGKTNYFGIKLFQEVAEAYLKDKAVGKKYEIKFPKAVYDYLSQSMLKEKKEVFKVLYLNSANKILGVENIFCGTVDQAVIYPRDVVKAALERNSTRLIFAHNHPSGNPEPSEHDIEITRRLKTSCGAVDIEVLDHIIIGEENYYSFREHGIITSS